MSTKALCLAQNKEATLNCDNGHCEDVICEWIEIIRRLQMRLQFCERLLQKQRKHHWKRQPLYWCCNLRVFVSEAGHSFWWIWSTISCQNAADIKYISASCVNTIYTPRVEKSESRKFYLHGCEIFMNVNNSSGFLILTVAVNGFWVLDGFSSSHHLWTNSLRQKWRSARTTKQ